MPSLAGSGTNTYQYASKSHLADGGFFPLDTLNPPRPRCATCGPTGTTAMAPPSGAPARATNISSRPRDSPPTPISERGQAHRWLLGHRKSPGIKHDSYFTDEVRYYFAYDGTQGISTELLRRRRSVHLHQRRPGSRSRRRSPAAARQGQVSGRRTAMRSTPQAAAWMRPETSPC
jgi:hypothetical protein